MAEIARAQDSLVTHGQLACLGLGRAAIAHRVAHRRLQRVLPRVYLAGPGALTERGRLQAPLLWAGHDTVLTGAASLWAWGCVNTPAEIPDLLVIGRHVASRSEVRMHRIPRLDARDIRIRHGLPVTSPALALHDYAAAATDAQVAAALSATRINRLTTDAELDDVLERHQLRAGTARLRRVLAGEQGAAITRSEAERRFLPLIRRGRSAPSRGQRPPSPASRSTSSGGPRDWWSRTDGYRFHSGGPPGSMIGSVISGCSRRVCG